MKNISSKLSTGPVELIIMEDSAQSFTAASQTSGHPWPQEKTPLDTMSPFIADENGLMADNDEEAWRELEDRIRKGEEARCENEI